MAVSKSALDAGITILAAVTAPALTLCVDTDTISATVATDIGGIVAAAVAAWHGGSIATARLTAGKSAP